MGRVTSINIDSSGGPYDEVPTIVIGLPDGERIIAEAEANIVDRKISSIDITQAGSFYALSDSSDLVVYFSEPDHPVDEVTFNVNTDAFGSVSIDIIDGGSYYLYAPTIVIDPPTDSASDAIASVTLNDSGYIASISILDSGNYYSVIPFATLNYYIADSAFSTTLDVTVTNTKVSTINFNTGDSGRAFGILDSADIVIDFPTGSPASFTASAESTVDNGVVTQINMTAVGSGYLVAPNVYVSAPGGSPSDFQASGKLVISDGIVTAVTILDSGNFYDEAAISIETGTASIDDFRATAIAQINENGVVISVTIVDSGNFYDTAPAVTFTAPTQNINFEVGEIVTETFSSGVVMSGEIAKWDNTNYVLDLIHVGADDGNYHEFAVGTIVGSNSGATAQIISVAEDNKISENEQNDEFSSIASDFLDFTENNPFGDPENN
jgi:hypothetical protein